MKMELNLPALERLIGGDTEIELALRQQIVHEFCKRHLREVATTEMHAAVVSELKKFVNDAAKELFGIENLAVNHLWPSVSDRLRMLLDGMVKKQIETSVEDVVAKSVERYGEHWKERLRSMVAQSIHREVSQLIKETTRHQLTTDAVFQQEIERLVVEGIDKRLRTAAVLNS